MAFSFGKFGFDYQYFTNVERIPEKRGAERAYARSAPLFSDFYQPFRDLASWAKVPGLPAMLGGTLSR